MNRGTELTSGGTWIQDILNTAVADDTWTLIELGATNSCRAISAGLRSGASFKMSHLSNGARYRTIQSGIELDIIKENNTKLFYVQTSSGNDTLECVLLD